MSDGAATPSSIISLPKGGGALQGIGETFSPDLFTGTGNFTVPIALPPGRNGFQPSVSLVYSTGNGNSPFGLGWHLSIPGVTRKTSDGIPRYQDASDTFVLSGAEDLVPIDGDFPGVVRYRPRTEGLFARIEYHRDAENSHWVVRSRDGLISTYGTPNRFNSETDAVPADIADPTGPQRIFAWMLTETRDPFGNRIRYEYARDPNNIDDAWAQLYLSRIQYVDVDEPAANGEPFLVSVEFIYANRPDPFSGHRSGFQIRTTRRCRRIEVRTHAGESRLVRSYQLIYLDERIPANAGAGTDPIDIAGIPIAPIEPSVLPLSGVSMLSQIHVIGHDDAQPLAEQRTQRLPPLEFGYARFNPQRRDFFPLQGDGLPAQTLSNPELELVDLFGNGLTDFIEMNGAVRYWRNLGGGRFDLPRPMEEAPAGISLADPGVQLIDANGDGRPDLLVSKPGLSGYYPLRFDGHWDRRSFQRYRFAPSFDLAGEDVQLVDLDGDGVTDAIRSANRLECYFNDPHEGWGETRRVERRPLAEFPNVDFVDPRVRWADMSGDGLQDIVLVYDGDIEYWPNRGYGNWGRRVHMRNSPRLPINYDPRQILIGDVDGDGAADLIFIDHGKIVLWINQSGNGWSEPIEIDGTPGFTNQDDVRLVDLLGSGVAGILWSLSALGSRRERFFFHDFTGGNKPYVLNEMNNHRGAVTQVNYRSSTEEYLRDQARPETRWRTPLPFPVQVVSKVVVVDEFSRGRLSTEYRYHHGYWDGGEREYRGFGFVETLTTETFENYFDPSNSNGSFASVQPMHYAAPTRTKSWFHLGPVGDEFGEWQAVDHEDEYWPGDAAFFADERSELRGFLAALDQRRDRRDALRALRGTMLRTELYALDGSPLEDRPYTVTETVHGLREVDAPAGETNLRRRIFFPHRRAQRTTQWERGDDPLTQIGYTDDYDEYGQPRRQLQVACPRGWRSFANDARPGTDYLTTYSETRLAQRDDDLYMVDRAAGASSFQIYPPQDQAPPAVTVTQLRDQAFNDSAPRELIGQSFTYYDGEAFVGLPLGELGEFGALVRSETLLTTESILTEAYRGDDPNAPSTIPPYLDPNGAVLWPDEYPEPFRQVMRPLAGHRFEPGGGDHARGYFVDSSRTRYDFQMPEAANPRGILMALRDPLERETTIVFDEFALLPERMINPVGLATTARNDYRVLQPDLVIDPSGNRTAVMFTPLGLPAAIAVMGKEEQTLVGDTLETPGTRFEYGLLAYDLSPVDNRQPVWVRTVRRVHHVGDTHIPIEERDDTIESVEYSDGLGRLLQTRTQAEDVLLGNEVFGNEVLPAGQSDVTGTTAPVIGRRRDPNTAPNVVVSGWQAFDNKGQVVEKYEPFFDAGWDYLSLEEAERQRDEGIRNVFGQRVMQFYDPRGQVIRTVNPDGSQQRVIYGVPSDLSDPDSFLPTPWEAYTYDANDLAPLSQGTDAGDDPIPLTNRAPVEDHFTPTSIEIDALGRTIRTVQRNGAGPQNEINTQSSYDIRGNVVTIIDAAGRAAFRYIYDLANRPIRVLSIDAGINRTVLDAIGNIVEQRDSKGALVLTAFDLLNRLIDLWARDNAAQRVTLRQHLVYGDAAGNGIEHIEARQRNTLGRVIAHYDEAGRVLASDYDFKGNLLEKTRQVINDQEILSVFEGAADNNWEVSAYQIDWQPQGLAFETRAAGILDSTEYTTSTQYDGLNRAREVAYPRDVDNERKVLRPRYNRAGALDSVTFNGDSYVDRIAYNAKGQRTLIAYGNGVMTRYVYDPRTFRLTRLRSEPYLQPSDLSYQPSGLPLQDFGYEYDLVGNITAIRDRTPESGISNTTTGTDALDRVFTYDPIYRLVSATGRECEVRAALPPWLDEPRCSDVTRTRAYTERYQYDPLSNMRVLQHQNEFSGFTRQFAVGANNNRLQMLTIGRTDLAYSYDASGNMTTETTSRHFEWDHGDRMKVFRTQTEGAEPSVYAHYLYDASGLRLKKLVRRQGGQFEVTAYLDDIFLHDRRVAFGEIAENNTLHVMDDQQRIGSVRAGESFAGDNSPVMRFQISDHLGSNNVLADNTGHLINREEFTPFGETSFGSFVRKRYRYTGRERDEESGLAYHAARYYAAWLARWTSCDPASFPNAGEENSQCTAQDESGQGVGETLVMPSTSALYSYADNNPKKNVDTEGLAPNPAVIVENINRSAENLATTLSNSGVLRGTMEGAIAEAQGAEIVNRAGTNRSHITSLINTGRSLVGNLRVLSTQLKALSEINPRAAGVVSEAIRPLRDLAMARVAAINQTIDIIREVRSVAPQRLAGIAFSVGPRTATSLASSQLSRFGLNLLPNGMSSYFWVQWAMFQIRSVPVDIQQAVRQATAAAVGSSLAMRAALVGRGSALVEALGRSASGLGRFLSRFIPTPFLFDRSTLQLLPSQQPKNRPGWELPT